MRSTRTIDISTGLFVMLGFSAILFMVTQITNRGYSLKSDSYRLMAAFENIGGLKKARAESRAASHMLDFEKRRARMEAVQAHLGLRAAAEKVSVARDAVAAAREGLRIVENQYREGLASMVDLLDVQAAATMAEGDLVQARYDYMVSLAELRYSAGAVGAATIEE